MKPTPSRWRQRLNLLLRLAVTVGLVLYVIDQVTWKDQVRLPAGQVVYGWLAQTADGQRVLHGDDGQTYPVPATATMATGPETAAAAAAVAGFQPGFVTLVRQVNIPLFVLALLVYPTTVLLMARRWQWLLRTHDLDPGFTEALRLTWIGMFTNNFLPGSNGGDFVKGVCIYRRTAHKRLSAVMSVLIDRILGLVSLLMTSALTLLLIHHHQPQLQPISRFVWLVLMGICLGGIVFFSARIRRLLRLSVLIDHLPQRLRDVDQSVFHYRQHAGVMGWCVAISLLTHFITILCIYALGLALGLKVEIAYYFLFLPVIFTVGAVFPSVAGLGVLESGFAQTFSLVGATASSAVALCLLYRIVSLLASLPGALGLYGESSQTVRQLVAGADEALEEAEQLEETDPDQASGTASSENMSRVATRPDAPGASVPLKSAC